MKNNVKKNETKLCDFGTVNDFKQHTKNTNKPWRKKIDNLGYIKMKNICVLNQVKRQATHWEKILTSHVTTKNSYPECTVNYSSIRKRQATQQKRGQKISIGTFTEEENWMANKYIKRCSTSQAIREIKLIPQDSISSQLGNEKVTIPGIGRNLEQDLP